MGGHGGLNILPQKSWNVYGRENRLKVARDEAKHAEDERVRNDKQHQVLRTSLNAGLSVQHCASLTEVFGVPHADGQGPFPNLSLPTPQYSITDGSPGTPQADGEVRRQYLLLQAQRKSGGAMPDAEAALAHAQAAALDVARANSSGAALAVGEPSGTVLAAGESGGNLLQHINFFQEHEARDQHPEARLRSVSALQQEGRSFACSYVGASSCT